MKETSFLKCSFLQRQIWKKRGLRANHRKIGNNLYRFETYQNIIP